MTQTQKQTLLKEIKKDQDLLTNLQTCLQIELARETHKQTITTIKKALSVLDLVIKHDFKKLQFFPLITTTHGGKMKSIDSLSTNKRICNTCRNNSCVSGAICQKCYAENTLKQYKQLNYSLLYNSLLLKYTYLSKYNMLHLNCKYFRFEAFSDLQNEIHFQNLIQIMKNNKQVHFALWTKNYSLIYKYLQNNKMPRNCNLILSSLFINTCLKNKRDLFLKTENIKENQIKIFTVYDKQNINNVNYNCKKSCINCLKCYKANTKEAFINELLK